MSNLDKYFKLGLVATFIIIITSVILILRVSSLQVQKVDDTVVTRVLRSNLLNSANSAISEHTITVEGKQLTCIESMNNIGGGGGGLSCNWEAYNRGEIP